MEAGINADENHGKLVDAQEAHDWVHGSLSRTEASINAFLARGLPFLATVGSTAPFVGLFGTVVGIYRALIAIGLAGSASIDKVAGPVGEALIMTAIGLLVAVPAVLAYNFLQARNKRINELLTGFSADVLAYINSKGAIKPAVPAAVSYTHLDVYKRQPFQARERGREPYWRACWSWCPNSSDFGVGI